MILGAGYLMLVFIDNLNGFPTNINLDPLLHINNGIDLEVGSCIETYDTSDGSYFKDEICWNGNESGILTETEARQVGANAEIFIPFCDDLDLGIDAGYRVERFQVWEDVDGIFVLQNFVKLYLNLNGREEAIILDAGIPYIELAVPCF